MCKTTAIQKSSTLDIFLVIFFIFVSIVCFSLGISGITKQYSKIKLGPIILSHQTSVTPIPDIISTNVSSILEYSFPSESPDLKITPINIKPYHFDIELDKFKAKCQTCERKKASFLYNKKCYYFSKEKHTFEECFSVCAQYADCYYFYAPSHIDSSIIRFNMRPNETLWVGAFKINESTTWTNLDNVFTYVWDIYGSYCSYIEKGDNDPRSYFYCLYPRHCLCAGESNTK